MYQDENQGLFSKRLAEWAIGNMKMRDPETGKEKAVKGRSIDEVRAILKENGVDLPDEFIYTAWYLFMMAIADYPKTCKTDADRASFVEETICDPDGSPENVLSCFEVKMRNAGVPIHWELYL